MPATIANPIFAQQNIFEIFIAKYLLHKFEINYTSSIMIDTMRKEPVMSAVESRNIVMVQESGHGPYGQFVSIGQHVMGADEPAALGGRSTGPDPFEFVLAGIGACTTMTIRMYANRKKWPLDAVRVSVRHVRAGGNAEGERPHAVERTIFLSGPLDDEQRAALMAIAGRCPVSAALETGMEITSISG